MSARKHVGSSTLNSTRIDRQNPKVFPLHLHIAYINHIFWQLFLAIFTWLPSYSKANWLWLIPNISLSALHRVCCYPFVRCHSHVFFWGEALLWSKSFTFLFVGHFSSTFQSLVCTDTEWTPHRFGIEQPLWSSGISIDFRYVYHIVSHMFHGFPIFFGTCPMLFSRYFLIFSCIPHMFRIFRGFPVVFADVPWNSHFFSHFQWISHGFVLYLSSSPMLKGLPS